MGSSNLGIILVNRLKGHIQGEVCASNVLMRGKKEYCARNRDLVNSSARQYKRRNRDSINERRREIYRAKNPVVFRYDENGRVCRECGEYKTWDEFGFLESGIHGHNTKCKQCVNLIQMRLRRDSGVSPKKVFSITEDGRECSLCGEFKSWTAYYTPKTSMCVECSVETRRKARRLAGVSVKKSYKITEQGRECSKCGAFKLWAEFNFCKTGVNYHKPRCRVCQLQDQARYRSQNREEILKRIREYEKQQRETNPQYRLVTRLRSRMASALKNNIKVDSTLSLLGCSRLQCVEHLEGNERGLSFDNWGRYGNHIDHIIPCSYFDLTNQLEQYICFNYKNLQLLPWYENLSKSNTLPLDWENLYNEILFDVLEAHPTLEMRL